MEECAISMPDNGRIASERTSSAETMMSDSDLVLSSLEKPSSDKSQETSLNSGTSQGEMVQITNESKSLSLSFFVCSHIKV
jgi:hypothetical protein